MSDPSADPESTPKKTGLLATLGPGLITGASDDDPSGIATYSQAGAQFGYDLGWTLLFSWPLMCAIQEISARIGRVTGRGLAGNLKKYFPRWILYALVVLLVVANTINLGADLGAMGAALKLLIPGDQVQYAAAFGALSLILEVFVQYHRYASVLKWMTFSLFAYLGVAALSHVPWLDVGRHLVLPNIAFRGDYLTVVVAVLGTTISPYLFFWQASEEVEDLRGKPGAKPLDRDPDQAKSEFGRIRWDTYIGMGLSNLVALAIMISAAATLNVHGVTNIQTSSDAAKALEPIAGQFAFLIFALGIIGTGLLAVPVLAGSAAYAVGETFGFHVGLGRKLHRAKLFYAVIALAMLAGVALNLTPIDPVKALFWSAVVNGVVAVPVMVMTMMLGGRKAAMGPFTLPPILKLIGWIATIVMAIAAVGMFATLLFMPAKP
jgi:NRAMP (natural resistance-associated macrophage protein)-like metal ion transporter